MNAISPSPRCATNIASISTSSDAKASLLSIEALGRHCRALETAYDSIGDVSNLGTKSYETARDAIFDQEQAVTALILSMPARTLADAVVQIGHAMLIAESLVEDGYPGRKLKAEHTQALLKVLLSVFPVVAAHCETNARDLVENWCFERSEREFGMLASPAGGAA